MKIILTIICITGVSSLSGCKKDTATICENLLEQGTANPAMLVGEWEFKYHAKTSNGSKMKYKRSILGEKWIGFDSNNIRGGICNSLGGNYSFNSSNNISISVNSTTFKLCDPETNELESVLLESLNSAQCFVVRNNELIIHYLGDKRNILILTKQ